MHKYVFIFFVVAATAIPSFSFAETDAALEKQIGGLQQAIHILQQQRNSCLDQQAQNALVQYENSQTSASEQKQPTDDGKVKK